MKKPEKPTLRLAVLAKCHNCTGYYADGITDCEVPSCPLYKWMPRGRSKIDLGWMEFNPRKKGLVRWENCGVEMTEEQKIKARERLQKARDLALLEKDLGL